MYTSKQAILDMIAAMGPQDFPALVRECHTQAIDNPSPESVRLAIDEMIAAGLLFTDGLDYSNDPDDVAPVDAGMSL